jgi:hypothetical protein
MPAEQRIQRRAAPADARDGAGRLVVGAGIGGAQGARQARKRHRAYSSCIRRPLR